MRTKQRRNNTGKAPTEIDAWFTPSGESGSDGTYSGPTVHEEGGHKVFTVPKDVFNPYSGQARRASEAHTEGDPLTGPEKAFVDVAGSMQYLTTGVTGDEDMQREGSHWQGREGESLWTDLWDRVPRIRFK
jgi:hypothetical protein